jgi:hypothetical protein
MGLNGMSEQASYEYGISPNHTDYDRARVDKYMAAIVAAVIGGESSGETPLYYLDDERDMDKCAGFAVKAIIAVDKAIYETTP